METTKFKRFQYLKGKPAARPRWCVSTQRQIDLDDLMLHTLKVHFIGNAYGASLIRTFKHF